MQLKTFALLCALMTSSSLCAKAFTLPTSCGNEGVKYKVKIERKPLLDFAPEAGMAKVIFIESLDGDFPSGPTTRIGLDGNWTGAVRGASYFAFSVTPGAHTLCASRQSATQAERDNVATSPLNAKAGQVYFFEFKITRTEVGSLDRQGGSSLPQQYPGGMTAKDKPTSDQASLSSIDHTNGETLVSRLPVSLPATK